MRVLLVEPESAGHHLVLYTRLVLAEAFRRQWRVDLVTTKSAYGSPAFRTMQESLARTVPVVFMSEISRERKKSSLALMAQQLSYWRALKICAKENRYFSDYDVIYCINLDYFEKALALLGSPFGPKPFAGMFMNPKFHRAKCQIGPPSRSDVIYEWLFERLLSNPRMRRLSVIDGLFAEYCRKRWPGWKEKVTLVPEAVDSEVDQVPENARSDLGIQEDRFVILLYGSLSRRKGVEALLRAVDELNDKRIVCLIAGRADPDIIQLFATDWVKRLESKGTVQVREGFLDTADEQRVFAAADVVWLGYVGGAFGSSGVLLQAGARGLPVISMPDGLIGWTVTNFGLGVTVNPTDREAVAATIRRLMSDELLRTSCAASGRAWFQRYADNGFATMICDSLEQAVT